VNVAIGHPRLGALVTSGADLLGRFQFDLFLQHEPDSITDQLHAFTSTKRIQ
jgi:hypothetical protein